MVAKSMSVHVGEAPRGDGERSPMLSADSVQFVVTINPVPHTDPKLASVDLRRRRQSSLLNGSKSRYITSVATSSFSPKKDSADEAGYSTTTLVATCNGGATGRIHLATIVERPGENNSRVVRMKYSSKAGVRNIPSFATVCIANFPSKTNQPSAAILAIDVEGKLHVHHHVEKNESNGPDANNHLFDMELCFSNEVDVGNQKSPKRGRKSKAPASAQSDPTSSYPFTSMNTLTARMESVTANNSKPYTSEKNSQESLCSTPKRKGRKRKATTPSKRDEGGRAAYVVASSLNESHLLPSQYPPVIIRLSFDESDPGHESKLERVSWSKIPGLEHVNSPMACITFASRAYCGNQLWGTLVSLMRYDKGQDRAGIYIGDVDEGIVLMGFRDGSLYATTVINGEPGHASKLLQFNSGGEPFLSLQILRTESAEPKLMCVGALGTLAIIDSDKNGAVKVDMKRLPFYGRSCSLACVGYHKSASNGTDLSLIGTNDTGKTYLYQLFIKCKESTERQAGNNLQLRIMIRVPISCGNVSSGARQFEFVWSSQIGKVSLIRIAPDMKIKLATRSKQSLLATLRKKEISCSLPPNRIAQETNAVSKYETVTQTVKAAISTKHETVDVHSSVVSLDFHSNQATKEVRDAIRIVSLSSSNAPPIQCTINASNTAQGFDLGMKNEKIPASSSWYHSVHTISSSMILPESIKDMTPLCYRRTRDGLVKVLYGGSSASLSCQNSSSMHVPMYDFAPVSVYASLSKIFIENRHADNIAWEESVRLDANVDVLNITGQAKRAHMQGAVVPFKLGKKSSVPLSGDVFTPFLKFVNIVRVDGSEDVRNAAEKEVQQLVQGAGGRKSLLAKMMDDTIIYGHSNASEKVHCCSSSVLLASSKNMAQYDKHGSRDNAGIVPIALALNSQKDTGICELGFAFGSVSNNTNKFMSLLPLMRQSIIRYSQREEELRSDVPKDECYSRLLSEKQAAKIVKHVDKCARELLSRIEMSSSNDTCPSALLTKCVSLYEIMRTLQFIIG
jgi:hypothetical protein